ncbi:DUF58 domain-containing protein [Paenibacillus sp. NEAU-GSW1]|uniref:DUF58 domain-containing protein n=1 Tax=Paenibacillus sp. NEAU-GSW1 TaxID=2682486 RepID=UPI0012E18764|nr:DUF58 domain-containing protein [Paenibacillus sp. NEAU-GSW1]MUT65598.1 DUF58 domain-containing protein [Paenibacillus sp. NEAU-GSW1]
MEGRAAVGQSGSYGRPGDEMRTNRSSQYNEVAASQTAAGNETAGANARLADSADAGALSGAATGSSVIQKGSLRKGGNGGMNGGATDAAIHEKPYRTRWFAWTFLASAWCASFAAMLTRGGEVEAFLVALLSCVIAISAIGPYAAVAGLSVERSLSATQVRDGDSAMIRVTVRRSAAMPFSWIAVRDGLMNAHASSDKEARVAFRYIAAPLFRKQFTFEYTVNKLQRGEHRFDLVAVTVGDWLGLTAITRKLSCEGVLLALPALPETVELRGRDQAAGGVLTDRGASHASIASKEGEAADASAARMPLNAGIGPDNRPYREGDSLRHIDWRAAAKGRGLYTKQHAAEKPAELAIMVDASSAAYSGDGRLFDACAAWAAQAIDQAAAAGGSVRLLAASGAEAAEPLLERLAKLRLEAVELDRTAIRKELGVMRHGGVVHAYTADWHDGKGWTQLAAYASDYGCRLELHVVTKQSVLTYAMREQQRILESSGIRMTWLPFPERMSEKTYTAIAGSEGGGSNERF